jgi:hypothetical protein
MLDTQGTPRTKGDPTAPIYPIARIQPDRTARRGHLASIELGERTRPSTNRFSLCRSWSSSWTKCKTLYFCLLPLFVPASTTMLP